MSTKVGAQKIEEEMLAKKICCGQGGIGHELAEILGELLL
jgi:hypothetical protein